MSIDIQSLNQKAEKRVTQAHDLLVLLQRSDMSDQKDRTGKTVVDHGVVCCALEGIADLLDEAGDLMSNVNSQLLERER